MDTLTVQVWKLDFTEFKSPAAKLVALALARRSRDSGHCWARQSLIGSDCGVSKQTVSRCIQELEEAGLVKRVPRHRPDGGRSTDLIWLTLPEIVIPATTVDPKEARRAARSDKFTGVGDDATLEGPHISEVEGVLGAVVKPPLRESTLKDSLKESDRKDSLVPASGGDPSVEDIAKAVGMIWARASRIGRQRSSKADITTGLQAALKRGHLMETVLKGLGGYFASPDATKEDGAFQRGAHVMLAGDRFLSFLDEGQTMAPPTPGEARAAAEAQAVVGSMEAPSEALQRAWMDREREGMPWNPERGPRPGMAGCRVDPAIQREYGFAPVDGGPSPPPADDAGAAFD